MLSLLDRTAEPKARSDVAPNKRAIQPPNHKAAGPNNALESTRHAAPGPAGGTTTAHNNEIMVLRTVKQVGAAITRVSHSASS